MIIKYLINIYKSSIIKSLLTLSICIETFFVFKGIRHDNIGFDTIYRCIHFNVLNIYTLSFLYMPIFFFICINQYKYFQNDIILTRLKSRSLLLYENIKINIICAIVYNFIIFIVVFISMIYQDGFFSDTGFIIDVILQHCSLFLGMIVLSNILNVAYYFFSNKPMVFIIPYTIIALEFINTVRGDYKINLIINKILDYYENNNKLFIKINFGSYIYLIGLIILIFFWGSILMDNVDFIQKERTDEYN